MLGNKFVAAAGTCVLLVALALGLGLGLNGKHNDTNTNEINHVTKVATTGNNAAIDSDEGSPMGTSSSLIESSSSLEPSSEKSSEAPSSLPPTFSLSERGSMHPSFSPSQEPTPSSSFLRSKSATPSQSPTTQPSGITAGAAPTRKYSTTPSSVPSVKQTHQPTPKPTGVATTATPTQKYSANPSSLPSMLLSTQPTLKLSGSPTSMPVQKNSVSPSFLPSIMTSTPTSDPSIESSSLPSMLPTSMPTSESSILPTEATISTPVASSQPTSQGEFQYFQCSDEAVSSGNCCNGLEDTCDLKFNQILIPVVHNAIATEEDGYPNLPFFGIRPNNFFSLERAMDKGYRGLSLDICNCNGYLQLCHGICGVGSRNLMEVLTNIVVFLKENPTEIIMLNVQIEDGLFDNLQPVGLYDLYNNYMSKVEGLIDLLYVHDDGEELWPTLRTLIQTDNRLLVFHFNGLLCQTPGECPPGLHYWFGVAMETAFASSSVEELEDITSSCRITRGAGSSGDFFGINGFVTPPDPRAASETTNTKEFIERRINDCSAFNDKDIVNAYFIDYWSVGSLLEITHKYNKQTANILLQERHSRK